MPFVIAQGPEPAQSSQRKLRKNEVLQIGRLPECDLAVGWDRRISRHHARLTWENGQLSVFCNDNVLNESTAR